MWHFVLTHGGYLTRGHRFVSSNPVANKGKPAFNFLEEYIILQNIYFQNKNRWQSDKVKEYGNARVMSLNPVT